MKMSLDLNARLELVQLFYKNGESPKATLRAYKRIHGLRKDPFPPSSISRLIKKFELTKSLHDIEKPGRPSLSSQREKAVSDTLKRLQSDSTLGIASTTGVAQATGIPQASVHRILRNSLGMMPYHISLHQDITNNDMKLRLEFARWILQNQGIEDDVLWSDEAYFSLDGVINRHNCVIWAFQNPHMTINKSLHSPKLCVWMAFSKTVKITPFFFATPVNGDNYTSLLKDHLFPQLRQLNVMDTIIFQHDGAPPHFSKNARDFLEKELPPCRVIGRGYGKRWPPRSPDLSPLDYYFWGTLKARVYHNSKPTTLDELQERICREIDAISLDEIAAAISGLIPRLSCVVVENGGHIEHLR